VSGATTGVQASAQPSSAQVAVTSPGYSRRCHPYLLLLTEVTSERPVKFPPCAWVIRCSREAGTYTLTYLLKSGRTLMHRRLTPEEFAHPEALLRSLGLHRRDFLLHRLPNTCPAVIREQDLLFKYLRSPNLQKLVLVPYMRSLWMRSGPERQSELHLPRHNSKDAARLGHWTPQTICGVTHETRLAFLMGLHRRLGEQSPVRMLPKDVVRYIFARFLDPGPFCSCIRLFFYFVDD
jgi:hypothetical protein